MTDRELKKLNRAELLEMMIALTKENEELKNKIEAQQQQLDDKNLSISTAGSIAEASLKVNGIFEAAQAAAEQYLMNIRNQEQICKGMQLEAEAKAAQTVAMAEEKAARTVAEAQASVADKITEAEAKAAKTLTDAEINAKMLTMRAQTEANSYWETVSKRLEAFYEEHQSLKSMLSYSDRTK